MSAKKKAPAVTLGKTEGPDGERSAPILLDGVEIGTLETSKRINFRPAKHIDFSHVYVMLWAPDDYEGTFDADTYGDANTARRAALAAVRAHLAAKSVKAPTPAPVPVAPPALPTTPTAPRTLADVLRPYCIDAEDVENAVDEVRAAVSKGVQSALTRVAPRLPWTFVGKQTQSYGFDSREHGDLEGATLHGTVTYPEYAVLRGTVKLGLHKHWSAGLLAASRYLSERTVATNIEMIPYVPDLLLPIAQEALAEWQPSFNADDLEERMWRTNAAEDDSETEYTDRDGEVVETHEGVSAGFQFRFEPDRTAPPTVTLDENGFLLVRVDARVRVRLSRIYDPWDKPREYGGFR